MKRRKHKRRKEARGGKQKRTQEQEDIQPKKEERQQEKKDKIEERKGIMKENQTQRHQQKRPNTTNKNTEKLTRTMTKKTRALIAQEKFNHSNDRKGPFVKKGKSKKYQTIVLVFLKMNGKGRRMQRQIYRDRFVALTKIAYFGPLGAKIAFCGLASLALCFQWFQFGTMFSVVSVKFRRFWKHRFFVAKTRRDTEKHKNDDGRGTRNKFWPFFRNPDFDLHIADLRPTM